MIDKRIFCYPSVRIGLGGSEKVCRGKREGGACSDNQYADVFRLAGTPAYR